LNTLKDFAMHSSNPLYSLQPSIVRPGHCAGDFLQSGEWKTVVDEPGEVTFEIHLPQQVLNPHGELYGGFTGTYVDLVAIYAVKRLFTGQANLLRTFTVNMRLDYLEPIVGPRLFLESKILKNGRSTCLVSTHFISHDDALLVHALTTVKKVFRTDI